MIYEQDDWRINRKPALNLGVRYENYRPWTEEDGKRSRSIMGYPGEAASELPAFERVSWCQNPGNRGMTPPIVIGDLASVPPLSHCLVAVTIEGYGTSEPLPPRRDHGPVKKRVPSYGRRDGAG